MKENKTKPDIRFKGFTEAWEQRKLGDILQRRVEQKQQSEEYPRLAFASGQGVIPLSERKTNNREQLTKDEFTKKYLVTELDDIVYNPANVKYGAIDRNKYGRGLISPIYVTFTTSEISGFIERIVTSHDFQQRALRFEEGTVTKRQSVNPEDLITLDILIAPQREEQRKISECFGNLDNLITLHQRECDHLKELKKSMLKKMFPRDGSSFPEVRFAGFTDAWEQRKLIDLCDYVDYRGKTPNKSDSGIFLVTAKNVKDGYIDYDVSKEYIPEDKYEEVMRRGKPKIGDVLITTEAPCGNVAQVNKPNIALAQRIIKYRGHNQVIDNTYLKYYLLSPFFQNILNMKSSGGTVQGIKGSVLHQQKISFTKYTEQLKIGQCLDSLDSLITLHQRELEILKNLKKTCLKRMFI